MAGCAEAGGDLAEAVALTRRQVALDPLAEEAHLELIRRLAENGDRSAALMTYRRLADRFACGARDRALAGYARAGRADPRGRDDATARCTATIGLPAAGAARPRSGGRTERPER